MKKSILLFSLFLSWQTIQAQVLFKKHQDGYNMFRIPTIVQTKSGKILAFCEGRGSLRDGGNIDLVMKSSTDNGLTWSDLKVIWNDAKNTCGNPSPVVDIETGAVLVIATLNNDRVFLLRSNDEGNNWESPKEITASTKLPNWKWYASGPVHAIQLTNSSYKNRIVVPCNHTVLGKDKHISHCIFSDDSGETWNLGESVAAEQTDECTVAELSTGTLLLNMRNNDRRLPNRKVAQSFDGGKAWTIPAYDSTLVEPICQGSLLRHSSNLLLFSNPNHEKSRKNLSIAISENDGKSWARKVRIFGKKSAYSDLVELDNGDLLCIYETGWFLPYARIVAKRIKKEELFSK